MLKTRTLYVMLDYGNIFFLNKVIKHLYFLSMFEHFVLRLLILIYQYLYACKQLYFLSDLSTLDYKVK